MAGVAFLLQLRETRFDRRERHGFDVVAEGVGRAIQLHGHVLEKRPVLQTHVCRVKVIWDVLGGGCDLAKDSTGCPPLRPGGFFVASKSVCLDNRQAGSSCMTGSSSSLWAARISVEENRTTPGESASFEAQEAVQAAIRASNAHFPVF